MTFFSKTSRQIDKKRERERGETNVFFRIYLLCVVSYRGLSMATDPVASSRIQPSNHLNANRVYNSHSSYPMKPKQHPGGSAMTVSNYSTNSNVIASAPPVVSAASVRLSGPSSGAMTERIPRLVSGRTDWAAKYLKSSTKYSK